MVCCCCLLLWVLNGLPRMLWQDGIRCHWFPLIRTTPAAPAQMSYEVERSGSPAGSSADTASQNWSRPRRPGRNGRGRCNRSLSATKTADTLLYSPSSDLTELSLEVYSLVICSVLMSERRENGMSSGLVLVQQDHKHVRAADPVSCFTLVTQ